VQHSAQLSLFGIQVGRFEDTNRMFAAPERFDLRVLAQGTPQYWAEQALALLRPAFDPQKPTALFIGRYQPFHDGHRRLIEEGLRRVGQVCIAVRDTHGIGTNNPLPFFAVKQRIEAALSAHAGRFVVMALPEHNQRLCMVGTLATQSNVSHLTRRRKLSRPR
jgi:cytidyltransferase-like protein